MARSFLILHGLGGSGPAHWQTWLAHELAAAGEAVSYPRLPDPDAPQLPAWSAALSSELVALQATDVTVVCHSLACVLWLHHAAKLPGFEQRADRVLLVAPASAAAGLPELANFFPVELHPGAVRAAAGMGTRVVCSDDDPYCPEGAVHAYAEPLGLPVDVLPGAAHINPETGYGPWPDAFEWCVGERPGLT